MNDLTNYLKDLYNDGFGLHIEYWLIILLAILFIMFIGVKGMTQKHKRSQKESIYFNISLASIKLLVCLIGIVLFFCVFLFIFFYMQYFVEQNLTLDLITLLLLLSIIFIFILIRLKNGVKQKLPKYIKPPLSLTQKTEHGNYISNKFEKSKWKIICLIFPFALLLFHSLNKPEAEVSILIDNSSSTDMYRQYGQEGLAKAIDGVFDNTKFNITYFATFSDDYQCNEASIRLKKNTKDIIIQTNSSSICCVNNAIVGAENAALFIKYQEIETSCIGTPLLESLWSNYLFTLQNKSSNDNAIRILILLTDGEGNLFSPNSMDYPHTQVTDDFDIFEEPASRDNISMYDYYDEISIINIGDNEEDGLFYNFQPTIYDGQDMESYTNALKTITKSIQKRNWIFIYIIVVITILVLIIFVATKLHIRYN